MSYLEIAQMILIIGELAHLMIMYYIHRMERA